MDPETVIPKFITAMPSRFEVGKGPVVISGVMIEVDTSTGKTKDIQRFQRRLMIPFDETCANRQKEFSKKGLIH